MGHDAQVARVPVPGGQDERPRLRRRQRMTQGLDLVICGEGEPARGVRSPSSGDQAGCGVPETGGRFRSSGMDRFSLAGE
ncbi:hypothetical protein CFR72_05470 [Gluconacetobacter entanii]|uniref:Uncharacterized protein n=1 Tax=Gluconacetobacter entanii TaxID=108528 RepID=A0A318PZ15_9PROT|nr:hypothetical protein CFR72_05470 [Gluconacetobacter entanii]